MGTPASVIFRFTLSSGDVTWIARNGSMQTKNTLRVVRNDGDALVATRSPDQTGDLALR